MTLTNRYYLVTTPVALRAFTDDYVDTNASYGAARLSKRVSVTMTARPGDHIHDLMGGRFLVVAATGKVVRLATQTDGHAFERTSHVPVPRDATREVPATEVQRVKKGGYPK